MAVFEEEDDEQEGGEQEGEPEDEDEDSRETRGRTCSRTNRSRVGVLSSFVAGRATSCPHFVDRERTMMEEC